MKTKIIKLVLLGLGALGLVGVLNLAPELVDLRTLPPAMIGAGMLLCVASVGIGQNLFKNVCIMFLFLFIFGACYVFFSFTPEYRIRGTAFLMSAFLMSGWGVLIGEKLLRKLAVRMATNKKKTAP